MKKKLFLTSLSLTLIMTLVTTSFSQMIETSQTSTTYTTTTTLSTWKSLTQMPSCRDTFNTAVIDGKIYAIGGNISSDNNKALSSVEIYSPLSNSWSSIAPLNTPRVGGKVEVVNGKIYILGGYDGSEVTSSVEQYNPKTNKWIYVAPMKLNRYIPVTAVINGKIYVIGNDDSDAPSSILECYDPLLNKWTNLRPMKTPRATHKSVVLDGKIYAIGGNDYVIGGDNYNLKFTAERYDPSINKWTDIAPLKTLIYNRELSVLNGKIYAIGGIDTRDGTAVSMVEAYNPLTNKWRDIAPMSLPRYSHTAVVVNNKIYAIGGNYVSASGEDGSLIITPSAEVYNANTNSWTSLSSMSVPRYQHRSVTLNGKIYTIGGNNSYVSYQIPENTLSSVEVLQ